MKSQHPSRGNARRRLWIFRPRVELLEGRLPLGDAALGLLTSQAFLASNFQPAVLSNSLQQETLEKGAALRWLPRAMVFGFEAQLSRCLVDNKESIQEGSSENPISLMVAERLAIPFRV